MIQVPAIFRGFVICNTSFKPFVFQYMSVCLDESIIQNPCGAEILMALKNAGVKYDVQKQSYPNIITFWRETTEVIETETNVSVWYAC